MSFIAPIIGPAIRQGVRTIGRYVYQGLRQQDKIIDVAYRRTGLYNRGVVRGIKHGLAGGQIIGGTLSLGLNEDFSDPKGNAIQKKPRYVPKTRKSYKTRNRRTSRNNRCYPAKYSYRNYN